MDINDEPDKIDSVQDPTAHDPDSTTEVGIMAEDKTENQIAYENDDNRNAGDKIINEAIIDTNKPTTPETTTKRMRMKLIWPRYILHETTTTLCSKALRLWAFTL
jgi:hypothetical protein